MKYLFFAILTLVFVSKGVAQEALFKVNNTTISSDEFKRVYTKNIDLVKDESQKDIDQYLELYVNYKLKLEEAKALNLDKKPTYVRELSSYRRQLAQKYLTDTEVTDQLLTEAYKRTIEEVNVDHILIRLAEDAQSKDTLKAYNELLDLRKKAKESDFKNVMKSVHDGKTVYGEELGFFSAFSMVYPFENISYTTPVGEISQPFRTKFGYHIIKVNAKRKNEGEVSVAHIMVLNSVKTDETPKSRIEHIEKLLQEGMKFEDLAKQFSDDKNSARKGGKLSKFGKGKLNDKKFEDVAFSLNTPNEVSIPFQSKFGWHIIKLLQKYEVTSFDDMTHELKRKVTNDSRSKIINEKFYNSLRSQYGVKVDEQTKAFLQKELKDQKTEIKLDSSHNKNVLFTYADKNATVGAYIEFYKKGLKKYVLKYPDTERVLVSVSDFINKTLYNYHNDNLENINKDFAAIMQEYREGLLLFDLMETKIWQKSEEDTLALKKYYEDNKNKFFWNKRINATLFTASDKKVANTLRKALESGMSIKDITSKFSDEVIITKGAFEKGSEKLPNALQFIKGTSKVLKHNNQYIVVKIHEVKSEEQKSFEETKGKVINDYQLFLEEMWIEQLKKKYTVTINHEVLNQVKKELKN